MNRLSEIKGSIGFTKLSPFNQAELQIVNEMLQSTIKDNKDAEKICDKWFKIKYRGIKKQYYGTKLNDDKYIRTSLLDYCIIWHNDMIANRRNEKTVQHCTTMSLDLKEFPREHYKLCKSIASGTFNNVYILILDVNPDWVIKIGTEVNEKTIKQMNLKFKFALSVVSAFNLLCKTKIDVLMPFVMKCDDGSLYFIEKMMDGEFLKFMNNYGSVIYSERMQALAHYSFEYDDQTKILTDLQGFEGKDDFVINDLTLHTTIQNSGDGDLGTIGINKFFETHLCNKYCSMLKLKKNNPIKKSNTFDKTKR